MAAPLVVIFGGSGFIGTALTRALSQVPVRVLIPTRRLGRIGTDLRALPNVEYRGADVHDPAVLSQLVSGADVVINLVGILQGSPADFQHAHVDLTVKITAACRQAGVRRYLHMSALGADLAGPSLYQRSKATAEKRVRQSLLDWTIYRPSVVFGAGDRFLSLFARLQRFLPLLPLAGAQARFQPVWVEDVAQAFVAGVQRPELIGQTLSLVGPKVYTLAQLVRLAGKYAGTNCMVVALPDWAARMQATLLSVLSNPPISHDNLDSLTVDNVDPAGFPALLGWQPTALEAVAPAYLAAGCA
ncbi:MAG: complex I NDUFA9 subunit family protein [Formivibrio sp.]|nr:complex I NDUFA9 subunit family protein [Formivibrio sp.]